jgi:hypothetical protein
MVQLPTTFENPDLRLSAINRISAYIESWWQQPRSFASVGIFCFLLLAMAVSRCCVAMYGMRLASHDGFMVLDGAWRMLNGQRPHVDFNSMIGPAAYLPTVVGLLLASNTAAGFGYGQALVAVVLGIWAYLLGAKLYETPRVIYALCVAAIAVSPALLGQSPFALTPAATYNRYAYALLGVLLLECLSTDVGSEFIAGLSSGALIAILAFTKMTFFLVGVALLVALIPQRTQTFRRWFGVAAGAVSVGLCFLWYLRFDLLAVIRDLAMTAGAKRVITELYLLNSVALDAGIALLLTFGASSFLIDSGKPRAAMRELLAGVSVTVASLLLIFGNFQPSELPLLGLYLLTVGQRLLANRRTTSPEGSAMLSLMIGGGAVFAGISIFSAIVSLSAAQWLMVHSVRAAPRFQAQALRQFVPLKDDRYTKFVNDGFSLLKLYRKPGERVMSLDFTNPFSYGLGIPPAPGGSTNLQYDGSFNAKHNVSPEKLFGAADLVMLPKIFSDESLQHTVPTIYGPFLDSHFELVGESSDWKLYRRLRINADRS